MEFNLKETISLPIVDELVTNAVALLDCHKDIEKASFEHSVGALNNWNMLE